MLRVGLTGGLGSGKSFVGRTLAGFGCTLIQADLLGHQALLPGGGARDAVIAEFGGDILDVSGEIDRRKLAARVFDFPDRLKRLNELVHPCVYQMEDNLAAAAFAKDPAGIVVVEAAILIETGSYKKFDRLIVAVCTEEQQLQRAMGRDGFTLEEAKARLRRQMPLAEKRKYADYVIDTSSTKENTIQQTRQVYESLRSIQV
ncbi:MAG TPA: dephospho-CoA kinase [Bryobacteraceae bacterium]|nr:dephospho-CoA kinase [Bryobacteraceae bacterium]